MLQEQKQAVRPSKAVAPKAPLVEVSEAHTALRLEKAMTKKKWSYMVSWYQVSFEEDASHKCLKRPFYKPWNEKVSQKEKFKNIQTPLSSPSLCEQVFGIAKGHHKAREKVEETLQCVKKTKKARHVQLSLSQLELKYWYIALSPLILTTRMTTLILDWLNPELQKYLALIKWWTQGRGWFFSLLQLLGTCQKGRIFWIFLGQLEYIFSMTKSDITEVDTKKTSQLNTVHHLNSTPVEPSSSWRLHQLGPRARAKRNNSDPRPHAFTVLSLDGKGNKKQHALKQWHVEDIKYS